MAAQGILQATGVQKSQNFYIAFPKAETKRAAVGIDWHQKFEGVRGRSVFKMYQLRERDLGLLQGNKTAVQYSLRILRLWLNC